MNPNTQRQAFVTVILLIGVCVIGYVFILTGSNQVIKDTPTELHIINPQMFADPNEPENEPIIDDSSANYDFGIGFTAELRYLRQEYQQATGPEKDQIADQAVSLISDYYNQDCDEYYVYLREALTRELIQWPALCRVDPDAASQVKKLAISVYQNSMATSSFNGYILYQILALQNQGVITWQELGLEPIQP